MSLAAGDRIGPFEILGLIGAGGMGEVYRARDSRLKRDAALKVLPDAFARDPERVARFRREAELLATLSHPNIASVYGLEEVPSDPGPTMHALVLESVEGPTLADTLATGSLPLSEAVDIAGQLTDALAAAHGKGVIHRDLKPANIKIWNPNGKEVFYRNGNAMMAVDVSTGPDVVLSQPRLLFEQRYASGAGITISNYDVSRDGQRFVMVKDESNAARLNVVINWFADLTRRATEGQP